MSILFLTEYARYARTLDGYYTLAPEEPPLAEQTIAIGAGSLQSAALNPSTRVVRISADVVSSIAVGANPTATATNRRIAANQGPEFIGIPNTGGPYKIAVIANT